MNPFHDSDEEYEREMRDRASEWPEPPEDWGALDSEDAQEAREESEHDIEAELRAEAKAKRGKPYDPRRYDWERIDAQAANDDAVAAMWKDARHIDWDCIDSSAPSETSFDRVNEGRSAT